MTRGRLQFVGACLLSVISMGLVTTAARLAWAQGPTPPAPPTPITPPTSPAAEAPPTTPSVPAPTVTVTSQAPLPLEVIKAMVAPVLGPNAAHVSPPAAAKAPERAPLRAKANKANLTADETQETGVAADANERAVIQASQQLDKFQKIFEQATKIFGSEHTVITPSFFVATDINGRLDATAKHMAGVSAVLLLPLLGVGGGHGADWWPVVTSADAAQIYKDFLDQLKQYQTVETNASALPADVREILNAKWDAQRVAAAAQIFCQEDIAWPANVYDQIKKFCKEGVITKEVTDLVTESPSKLVPKRHNLYIGPSMGIPLTKNPIDVFQLGAAVEFGWEPVRFALTGGLVGHYQGATYADIFGAGWFVGVALSGEIGDKLFHYFNGGSDLMAQLARVKTSQP
jgi:hypothetical protein